MLGWTAANGALVHFGWSELPFVSLALGLVGAAAVISLSALLATSHRLGGLRYCGENSIVIYLAFFLPMAATRTLLLKSALVPDVGAIALIVTVAGLLGALALWWGVRGTRLGFLFARPARFWIAPKQRLALQAAE